jgi:hypothetical protein
VLLSVVCAHPLLDVATSHPANEAAEVQNDGLRATGKRVRSWANEDEGEEQERSIHTPGRRLKTSERLPKRWMN